jgi:hypothetical protein
MSSTCAIEVSLDGKACPCADGYRCDEALNTCFKPTCSPKVEVKDLQAEWATPNTIAYRWTSAGEETVFLRYEMILAENREDLVGASGSARTITPSTNPEFSFYLRPQTDGAKVETTLVRELSPSTAYVARLFAIDSAGCAFGSNLVTIQTPEEARASIWLFENSVDAGYSRPSMGLDVVDGELVYTPANDMECAPMANSDPVCGQPIGVQDLERDIAAGGSEDVRITASNFGSAFLEARVSNVGEFDSHISVLWLWFNGCPSDDTRGVALDNYRFDEFTLPALPDRSYETIQVPLSALHSVDDGSAFSFARINSPLCGSVVGAQWNKTGQVRVDWVRIRY